MKEVRDSYALILFYFFKQIVQIKFKPSAPPLYHRTTERAGEGDERVQVLHSPDTGTSARLVRFNKVLFLSI